VGSGGKQSYSIFVLRDDGGTSDLLFQTSVTTYAVYNPWGGYSGYFSLSGDNNVATKVSFNRPYADNDRARSRKGAGRFLEWEVNMVRFLEREGYDVSYSTNLETHRFGAQLLNHKAFLSVGHDEYWTRPMLDNVEAAKAAGIHLAFFGANASYWQVRLEPSALTGQAERTVVAYRDKWLSDPYNTIDKLLVTAHWRDAILNRPESALIGVQYLYNTFNGDMVISDCSSFFCDGTVSPKDPSKRLQPGDVLPGMLGYELDAVAPASPSNIQIIGASPFVCQNAFLCTLNSTQYSHMTFHTSASGSKVFATGSMQWNWGVDAFGLNSGRVNSNVQQITRNVLNSFIPKPPKK
jgi:hypothetical protein